MAFELPEAVYSLELVESVIYDIESYLEWHREAGVQKKVGAKPQDEPTHSAETVTVIASWMEGKNTTIEALEKLLSHLKSLKLPVVHVTLAALPNHTQRTAIVEWFRRNVGHGVLISFVADRTMGGGLTLRTPNHVFDYSWRQRLIEGRAKLAGIVHHV